MVKSNLNNNTNIFPPFIFEIFYYLKKSLNWVLKISGKVLVFDMFE